MRKLIVILMAALAGCQSAGQAQPAPSSIEAAPADPQAEPTEADSENDSIFVGLSAPKKVKINETFKFETTLMSKTNRQLIITTGDPMFDFYIKNSAGKVINSFARTDIGVVRPIDGNEIVTEPHSYRFKTAGTYRIYASVSFTLQDGDDSSHQVLTTADQLIEVTE